MRLFGSVAGHECHPTMSGVYFTSGSRREFLPAYNLMQGSAAVTNLTLNTSPAFVYNTQGKSLVSGTNYVVFSTVTPTASGVIMITNGNYSALQLVKRTAAPALRQARQRRPFPPARSI